MEEFTVYHVVTEREMKVNQVVVFGANHTNGVYRRVMATMDILEGKKVGEELEKLITSNIDSWKQVAYRELALEKVRKESFNEYPSRMACLYVSQTYEDALTWATSFHQMGRKVFSIVKLKVEGRLFKGNAFNCFEGKENNSEWNEKKARAYWENASNKEVLYEYLVDGKITVEEILKTF